MKKLIIILIAAVLSLGLTSCSSVSQLEKQAIISAVGIDKGENARFKISAQVFQAMGAGSSTPVDSSQSNTIIVSSEADTVAECMEQISAILGRKINIGHCKYIVLGSGALSVPLSESLEYFICCEQAYLGVPVISRKTTARDIIDVKLLNEVETAIAVENIIRRAIDSGEALDTDLLSIANSATSALPVMKAVKPPEGSGDDAEQEETKLIFDGTKIVNGGNIVYTASQSETVGYCWLEGKLKASQLCISGGDDPVNVSVTLVKRRATIEKGADGYTMVYRIKARIKLLDSFGINSDSEAICRAVKEKLELLCTESFLRLAEMQDADFLGVEKIAHSVCPRASLNMTGIIYGCNVRVNVECSVDK